MNTFNKFQESVENNKPALLKEVEDYNDEQFGGEASITYNPSSKEIRIQTDNGAMRDSFYHEFKDKGQASYHDELVEPEDGDDEFYAWIKIRDYRTSENMRIKRFESFQTNERITPAEEGEAAARMDDYMGENPADEVNINLRALDDDKLRELHTLLKSNNEIIPDEDNEEAVDIIEKYMNSK